MSRSIAEVLSRFTPDGAGLDRDALVFAAGRASARPNRRYLFLTVCLAIFQVATLPFTLAGMGVRLAEPVPSQAPGEQGLPVIPKTPELPSFSPQPEGEVPLALGLRPVVGLEELPRPTGVEDLVPDPPPLRAFSAAVIDAN